MPSANDELEEVLAHGAPAEQDALRSLAHRLLEARTVAEAGAHQLPGVGPGPRPDELAGALARNEERVWRVRRRLYASALDYAHAADRLGVSTNQISNLVTAGELLAIDGPEGKRLPAWQLHPESRRGRLAGIAEVAAAYPGRVLGLSAWMTAPHPSLGGRTPADALADDDTEQVLAAAHVLP